MKVIAILTAAFIAPVLALAQQDDSAHLKKPSAPPGDLVKQAFLGVATTPVDPALGSQLGLEPGTGLLVAHISADSPAASSIQNYDVLTRFNDQVLINHEQLAVLVRLSGMKQTIKLELLRQGKKQVVEVTLGEREGLAADPRQLVLPSAPGGDFPFQVPAPGAFGDLPNQYQRSWQWHWDFGGAAKDKEAQAKEQTLQPKAGKKVHRHTWSRGTVVLKFVEEDGQRQLTVTDGGNEMFTGPINTREELEKVPKKYLPDVEDMLKELPR